MSANLHMPRMYSRMEEFRQAIYHLKDCHVSDIISTEVLKNRTLEVLYEYRNDVPEFIRYTDILHLFGITDSLSRDQIIRCFDKTHSCVIIETLMENRSNLPHEIILNITELLVRDYGTVGADWLLRFTDSFTVAIPCNQEILDIVNFHRITDNLHATVIDRNLDLDEKVKIVINRWVTELRH